MAPNRHTPMKAQEELNRFTDREDMGVENMAQGIIPV